LYAYGFLLCGLGQDLLNGQYDQQCREHDGGGLMHICLLLVSPLGGERLDTNKPTLCYGKVKRKPKRHRQYLQGKCNAAMAASLLRPERDDGHLRTMGVAI